MQAHDLNKLLLEYLQIPSEITKEKEFCDYLERRFRSRATHLEIYRLNHNLVLRTPPKDGLPTLGWFGHIDTVKAQEDQAPHESDEFMHGCGASDMKSGLAVMTAILEDAAWLSQLPLNLVFVFYEQEEGDYAKNGLQPVLEKFPWLQEIQLAFALEPTNNTIQNGCLGGLHLRVTFQGKRAHSARPWEGVNAIHKAGSFLTMLDKLQPKAITFGGLTFHEVISATLAQGGTVRNSIPESFLVNINYRFAPGKALASAKEELLALIPDHTTTEFIDEAPSGPCYMNNPMLLQFLEITGVPQVAKQAWTDVARLALFSIPAVNFGPGDTKEAHQKNEKIPKQWLWDNYSLFQKYLNSFR